MTFDLNCSYVFIFFLNSKRVLLSIVLLIISTQTSYSYYISIYLLILWFLAGSSQEFLVPSAPCVPEVYPLETLHNALTLSQLEAFLVRLTTHKFPTPFTSPKHPSTPVNYYHHHHHHQPQLSQTTLEFFSQYHDLCTNLSSSLPNSTGDDTATQDCSNIVDEASTQVQQPVSSNVTSIIPSAPPFQNITSGNTNYQQ